MNIANLSADTLRRAAKIKDQIAGLEKQFARKLAKVLSKQQAQLERLLGSGGNAVGTAKKAVPTKRRKRTMSAAAKKALSAKLKAAWARRRAAKGEKK